VDDDTTDVLTELYGLITNVYKAKEIRTAEAAKVIENIQRDLNIALMNELAIIFHKMGLDTKSVLDAASTKWNFQPYKPGLVGGHCIPVDPYYLVYKAKALGYHPQVILAGRAINDYIPKHVAEMAIKGLNETFLQAKTFTKKCLRHFLLRKRNISLVKFLKLFKRKVCDKRIGTAQRKLRISPCMGVEDCSVRSRNAVARLNFFSIFIDSRNSKEKKEITWLI
jgi:hypothetical protein